MKRFVMVSLLGCGLLAWGQTPAPARRVVIEERSGVVGVPATPGMLQPRGYTFVSGMNVGQLVTKAPYAADAVTESIQTLFDGNRIVERSTAREFRDSEGRERREEGAPLNAVFITDPVAKVSYTLHTETRTAEKRNYEPVSGNSAVFASFTLGGVQRSEVGFPMLGIAGRATPQTAGKGEDLGTRMIEGVEAKGTRNTVTIPAGEIGNDRAIDIVDERWYSSELQLAVLTRHLDPRSGETTYKLVNIQRLEQVRSLFELPADYTVRDNNGMFQLALPTALLPTTR